MALQDTLVELKGTSRVAAKNRVAILLDKLAGTEDEKVLLKALHDRRLSNAVLTRALQKEYGEEIVKPNSVREYRVNTLKTLTGM